MMPGANEMIASSFTGTVGAIRFVLIGFREGWIFFRQRTIDFVGGNMQEAEGSLLSFWQVVPVTTHRFEQVKGADDVGLDKFTRAMDGAIDVAFSGEVDDGTRFGIGQQVGNQATVTDAATNELVTWIAFEFFKVLEVTGVGEQVEVNDGLVTLLEPVEDKVRANKAGGSRY